MHMIASLAGLACAEATVGRRAGSTLGRRGLRQNRELPLVDPGVEVVWKLRLGPIHLTTRSASFELGLLGTRQRGRPWMRCDVALGGLGLRANAWHALV